MTVGAPIPLPRDPKADLEEQLVAQAMRDCARPLDPIERTAMRIVLRLFLKHPAMQLMMERRIEEEAAAQVIPTSALLEREESGVVPRGRGRAAAARDGREPERPEDRSGIVARAGTGRHTARVRRAR